MQFRIVNPDLERAYLLVFDKGDEVIAGLKTFAQEHGVTAARFTAIGAFDRATVAFFQKEKRDYDRIEYDEPLEVLALTGNIALHDGQPRVHAHVVLGKPDGTAHGGHLVEGIVWPTLELMLIGLPGIVERVEDAETGLALIRL